MPFGKEGVSRRNGQNRAPATIRTTMAATGINLPRIDLSCLASDTVLKQVVTLLGFRFVDWGLADERRYPDLKADARLVLDELVSNAVRATPDRQITVRVELSVAERCLCFAVWDGSAEAPKLTAVVELELADLDLAPEHFDRNGGRGLHLVSALCGGEIGVRWTERPSGKWTWAKLRVPPPVC